VKDTETRIY